MKRNILFAAVFWIVFMATAVAQSAATSSVSQWGITWYFDKAYKYGTFANGDYWVVGPVTITRITPRFTGTRNGWQSNPTNSSPQGIDSRCGDFSQSVVPSLPYKAQPGESIFKGMSRQEGARSPYLKTAAVLTVVGKTPPGDGADVFRPGYAGTDKTYYYLSDIRKNRLLSIATRTSGVSYANIIDHYQRVQVEHKSGATGRWMRPLDNMKNNYAPYTAGQLNSAIAKLSGTDSVETKWEALIYVIQSGIDRYNAALTGQIWPAGGGHQPGHKLSVAFAAYMLDDQGMKDMVSDTFWWENRLIRDGFWGYPVSETKYWNYVSTSPASNYEYADPYRYIDGGNALHREINSYQIITANNVKGAACWLRYMPEMKSFWSDADSLIAYAERWVSHGLKASPDPCAPIHPDDVGKKSSEWTYYGVTWGPDGKGGCIKGGGRFDDNRDGIKADTGQYQSVQMNEMWDLYSPEIDAPENVRIIK